MKNQYFGDINDYRKYGLLRLLTGMGRISTTVCWMLTPDDGRGDGGRVQYLDAPNHWRHYDETLFDFLQQSLHSAAPRTVDLIETSEVLPGCRVFSKVLADDAIMRAAYFDELAAFAAGSDLVFFDPDNGLEVKSKRYGRRQASKYVYMKEVEHTFTAGHSVLVFQFYPREPHQAFTDRKGAELSELVGIAQVYAFVTSNVVFFLLSQPHHERTFAETSRKVSAAWGRQIRVQRHRVGQRAAP